MTTIPLLNAVPRKFQDDILKNLYWVDEGIRSLQFLPDNAAIGLEYVGSRDVAEVSREISLRAEEMLSAQIRVPSKLFFEHRRSGASAGLSEAQVVEALTGLRWLHQTGDGTFIYAGPLFQLYAALERFFRRQAVELGAEEMHFPTLLNFQQLERSGYLNDYLHNVHLVSHLPEQLELIESLKKGPLSPDVLAPALAAPHFALSPTVCHHLYVALRDQVLPVELMGVTANSCCYRNEGRATRGLRRLREFSMREIIFLGQAEQVARRRQSLLDLQRCVMERLDLEGSIMTASDPFFSDTYSKKRLFQVSFELKYEVKAYLPGDDDWFAIGSVNYLKDYFGSRYNITLASGEFVHSCCLGFGLDRWLLAILTQCGIEPQSWPSALRQEMESL